MVKLYRQELSEIIFQLCSSLVLFTVVTIFTCYVYATEGVGLSFGVMLVLWFLDLFCVIFSYKRISKILEKIDYNSTSEE